MSEYKQRGVNLPPDFIANLAKPKVYHGRINNREELEIVTGDLLPKEAIVWFAYLHVAQIAKNENKYGLVCYYEFKNRFYGLMCGRMIIGGEALPWKRENYMFNPDNSDPRWHLETELHRAKREMDVVRERERKPEMVSIFEEVLQRMVDKEKEWNLAE